MRRPTQRGSGMLEFLLVLVVFGLLASALLARLIVIEQGAERTEVELTVRNIRVGLQLAVGEHLMRGQEDSLGELLELNPVSLLGRLPRGYVDAATDAGPGSWRFDPKTRILAYRTRQADAFEGRDELRWRLASQGILGSRIAGIRLESLSN